MRQTRDCTPDGCDIESRCVGPSFGNWEDQGCGADCGTAGKCDWSEQCQKRDDIYGCAEEYQCVPSPISCVVQSFNIYKGWNLISSPIADITGVAEDTCGATNGNFYYYNVGTGKWIVDTVGVRNLQKGIGYWFYSDKNCVVTIVGSGDVMLNDVTLRAGWNHIGSPTEGMVNAESVKTRCTSCAGGACSSMKVLWYDPIAKDFKEVSTLEAGKGYHVQCINPYYKHKQNLPHIPFLDFFK